MFWKACGVHGTTTVTQLPLCAAEQIPCHSQHLQYKQSRSQCCSQAPSPLSDVFALWESPGAHHGTMDTCGETIVL